MIQAKAGGFPKLTYVDKDVTVEDINNEIAQLNLQLIEVKAERDFEHSQRKAGYEAMQKAEAERDAARDDLANFDHQMLARFDQKAAGQTDLFTWISSLNEKFVKMLVYAQFLEKKLQGIPHAPASWFDGCHIVQYHVDGKCTVYPCLGCTCWKKDIERTLNDQTKT